MQGRAHVLVDMRIVDEAGGELPWDGKAFGELQVRGAAVVHRYFRVRAARSGSRGNPTSLQNQGFAWILLLPSLHVFNSLAAKRYQSGCNLLCLAV